MRIDLPPIPEAERTPLVVALLAIIDLQQQRIQVLEETVLQLRDEIAILKGQKPRPTIAPSTLEKPPKPPADPSHKRPGSAKLSKKSATLTPIEVTIPFPNPPPGSHKRKPGSTAAPVFSATLASPEAVHAVTPKKRTKTP